MQNVIIPAKICDNGSIDFCNITKKDLIVAYSGADVIGFVIETSGWWYIQTGSCHNSHTNRNYTALEKLVNAECKKYEAFNLKVL